MNKEDKYNIYDTYCEDDKRLTKVICITNKKIFDSLKDAAKYAGLKTTSGISISCKNIFKNAGVDPDNGQPLLWMYYDDYIKNGDICEKEQVICLNTMEIFNSIYTACEKYGLEHGQLGKACIGRRKYYGYHPYTNEVLKWMFVKDYNNLSDKQKSKLFEKLKKVSVIQKKGVNSYKYKVVCLTTGEKFKKMSDAAKKYGIDDRRIYDVCNGVLYSAGEHPISKEKLTWVYYKDYVSGITEPINKFGKKSVICLTTGEVYRKMNVAAKAKGIKSSSLKLAVSGKMAFAGIDEKTRKPLVWMFYKDYELDENKTESTKKIEKANSPELRLKVIREINKMVKVSRS